MSLKAALMWFYERGLSFETTERVAGMVRRFRWFGEG